MVMDIITICIAIISAFILRHLFDRWFELSAPDNLEQYTGFMLLYTVVLMLLYTEGIYTKRYDFWQELERISKAIFLSALIVLAVLAITKHVEYYSRFILITAFAIMAILLPIQKYFSKYFLFRMGWWKCKAYMIGNDSFFEEHVFSNPYLGYINSSKDIAKTLFISSSHSKEQIEEILHEALLGKQEVIFIPVVKNFDFSDAHIIHLFNARSNLIIVENNLLNRFNRGVKSILDYLMAFLILPLLMLIIGLIALKIKREDGGEVFFKQPRLGENGELFECYKFRSMREDGDKLLSAYLQKHPEEINNYEIYHKYENDPRITKIGHFLRKTSLDELPQIMNVLKGEMSLIGPRPYMPTEKIKIGENVDIILAVKPGITGLWQVSGRSDVDFMSRVEMDVWYVRNWSIWSDLIILLKTVQVVLGRKGSA
jgi:undecaprenyl-phosphate galactose phosphotransferase